ncbi:winged helix-turn-helix domain-containing protein [Agathobaculum sp. Marseille-P7918]|uniref:winged helix-turn-helix domain-containing protein n=1 Tax=Agathobaculum sp. Marseille-P7918 TaxID=2479843 RepID=UPI000F630905|nr:LysR family transcriptional regulator [Agathobaculum sp. Marseille-P7918]
MEKPLKVRASLRIVREDKLFGPGVAQLLEGVEELGSLRRSAARMEMSYNKAWSVVHGCEEQLGFALLERHIGGAGGGGAVLTEKGKLLLARYQAFSRKAHELLDQMAAEYFTDILKER